MAKTKAGTRAPEPAPMTTAEVLVELRQELAKQNELATQTLQLTLQLMRQLGGGGSDAESDPLVELGERARHLAEEYEAIDEAADPERDRLIGQELLATTRALFFTPAQTTAGAAAQVRRVLHEIDGDCGERADNGHAVALRSVLAFLEARP